MNTEQPWGCGHSPEHGNGAGHTLLLAGVVKPGSLQPGSLSGEGTVQ